MNRETFKRLREVIWEGWAEIYRQSIHESPGAKYEKQLGRAASRWRGLCNSLDIRATTEFGDIEPGGGVFEEFVVVGDPNPAGMWLEMTHETAEKILALGLT